MKLTRINPDHSWLLETPGLRLVVDPWLLGPEIDGFGWFHTQHLPQAAWPIAALGPLEMPASTPGGQPEARQWPSSQPDFGGAD